MMPIFDMWSNGFLSTIDIRPRARRWGGAYLAVLTSLALAGLAGADLHWGARTVLTLSIFCMTAGTAHRVLAPGRRRVRRIVVDEKGHWILHTDAGQRCRARLVGGWLAGPMAGLRWRGVNGCGYWAFIAAGKTDSVAWRRLRVRLRNPTALELS